MSNLPKNQAKKPTKIGGAKKVSKKEVVESSDATTADRRHEELMQMVDQEKYKNQVYEKETIIPVSAPLFVDFLNMNHENSTNLLTMRQGLDATRRNIENLLTVIDQMLLGTDIMTSKFAEKHIENVDSGLTRKATEEDMQEEAPAEQ